MDENIWIKKGWAWKKIGSGEHERSPYGPTKGINFC
jgi:hypothetical protein